MKALSFLLLFIFIACSTPKADKQFQQLVEKDFVDADDDGVDDVEDKCLKTTQGALVNGYGCAEKEKIQFVFNIEFPKRSSRIPKTFNEELTHLAQFLQKHPKTRAVIEGHTDNTESKAKCMAISEARAQSVRNFIIENYGIDAARLSAVGFGKKKPIADNKTAQGQKMNRRVVAVITSVQD
ncbi:MAG: OmpA family protein [Bacteriovoracaceae bacterium]